jgi:hypothetical protein
MSKIRDVFPRKMSTGMFCTLVVLSVLLAAVPPANATSIVVPNFSFESPALPDGFNNTGGNGDTSAITDWTITAPAGNTNNGVYHPVSGFTSTDPLPAPADGNQLVYLVPGTAMTSSITNTDPLTSIAANTTYMLTVALGNRNDTQTLTFDTGTYTLDILANGVSVAQNSLAGSAVAHGTFTDLSTSFISTLPFVGENLSVRLSATGGSENDEGIFDNVRLTATTTPSGSVPEPGNTAVLLAAATTMLAMVRRVAP